METRIAEVKTLLASDIMATRIHSFSPVTPIPMAIHELLQREFSEMPIVNESGVYCGMFSEKCCMKILSTLVELIESKSQKAPNASDVMVPRKKLIVLHPDEDVILAMSTLLNNRVSGAPVIDSNGQFVGVFSERTCMGFIIEAAYSGLPSAKVGNFIDPDSNRLIDVDTDLHGIAKIFVETQYGRLPVMQGNSIIGQISRRDVLTHSGVLACIMKHHLNDPHIHVDLPESESVSYLEAHDTLPDHTVSAFADEESHAIGPEMNLFSIAQLFFKSPHKRFPVLKDNKLVGQISRCDVLNAAIELLKS